MSKVLIVEDDVQLSEKIRDWLHLEKYVVEVVHNGADAIQLLDAFAYDIIVLDWSLPEVTGIDICKHYRNSGGNAPIIFLTGRDSITDKEEGLDSGADDYLTKPFHVKELSARIRACLRRPQDLKSETLRAGDLSLDTRTLKVTKANKSIHLQPKELALLEFLMRHPNQVFGSKALLDSVWRSDAEASDDTIRTCMKTLRRKVTADGEECMIKTVHGLGYKLETETG